MLRVIACIAWCVVGCSTTPTAPVEIEEERSVVVPFTDFVPSFSDGGSWNYTLHYVSARTRPLNLRADVSLPEGARITRMEAHLARMEDEGRATVNLYHSRADGSGALLAFVEHEGTGWVTGVGGSQRDARLGAGDMIVLAAYLDPARRDGNARLAWVRVYWMAE